MDFVQNCKYYQVLYHERVRTTIEKFDTSIWILVSPNLCLDLFYITLGMRASKTASGNIAYILQNAL